MATTLDKPLNTTATTTEFVRRASDMPALGKTRNVNLAPSALYERAIQNDEGILAAAGPLVGNGGTVGRT